MDNKTNVFQGNVQVNLQGQNALIPIGEISESQMTYFVGSQKTKLLVRDYRQNPVLAAKRALSGLDGAQFADIFSQPAYAEIFISNQATNFENIEICLYPTSETGEFPVFWFGVIDNLKMPNVDSEWEILRPINLKKMAFASLVKATNFVFVDEKDLPMPLEGEVYSLDWSDLGRS